MADDLYALLGEPVEFAHSRRSDHDLCERMRLSEIGTETAQVETGDENHAGHLLGGMYF